MTDRRLSRSSCGNAIMEYSVIGVIMVGAAVSMMGSVGGTFQGTLAELKQDMATRRNMAIQRKLEALSAGPTEQSGSRSKTFSETEANLLQQSLKERVQTVGTSGSTRLPAKQLSLLADKLLSEGKITQEQYDLLMQLSNQGYHIAKVEAMLEASIRQAGGDVSVFSAIRFNVDGQDQSFQKLADSVGFVGITPVTSGEFLNNVKNSAGQEMQNLLSLYQQVQGSGLFSDPVVQSTVESAVLQIAQLGEGVEDSIFVALKANQVPKEPSALNEQVASALTNMESDRVCKAGNFKSDGIQCSP